MAVDDRALRHALGPGGADVVGGEDLQHIGTGVAHQAADGDDHQRDQRQHEVLRHIQEFSEIRQGHVVAPLHARQVEPAELDGENVFQHRRHEEGGHGDAHHGDHRGKVVGKAVLLAGRRDAQRYGDQYFKYESDEAQREAVPHRVVEFHGDGNVPHPAVAPVAPHGVAEPDQVAPDHALVHAVLGVQVRQPLGVALGRTGPGGQLPRLGFHKARGHVVHEHVDDEHDEEQYQNAVGQAFGRILQHRFPTFCLAAPRRREAFIVIMVGRVLGENLIYRDDAQGLGNRD